MGVSTDGQLNFGIDFGEECNFPWLNTEDSDIEEWWVDRGLADVSDYPFTPEGEYKEGFDRDDPRVDVWYEKKRSWLKKNPVPIDDVFHCSYDYPCHVLAVKGKGYHNNRGSSTEVTDMGVTEEELKVFTDFLAEFGITTDEEPAWLLTSMWG